MKFSFIEHYQVIGGSIMLLLINIYDLYSIQVFLYGLCSALFVIGVCVKSYFDYKDWEIFFDED
ncbi:MAG: hypothetical protein ACFFG0_10425 [Candidatus Thorarchaeota archaeon]